MDALNEVICTAYEAVHEPALWQIVTQRLADAAGARLGLLQGLDLDCQESSYIHTSWSHVPNVVQKYADSYSCTNPYIQIGIATAPQPACWRLTSEEIEEPHLVNNDFYKEIFRPLDIHHFAACHLQHTCNNLSFLAFFWPRRHGALERRHLQGVQSITPCLARAAALYEEMHTLKGHSAQVERAVDYWSKALLVTDCNARILHANAAAQALMTKGDIIASKRGRLHARARCDTTHLHTMIWRAAMTANGRLRLCGGTVCINGSPTQRPLTAQVFPGTSDQFPFSRSRPTAIVVISDSHGAPAIPSRLLRTTYGLTPKEAEFAVLFAEELNLRIVAERMKVTWHTARTYERRVHAKMGVKGQLAFVRLVSSLFVPFEHQG